MPTLLELLRRTDSGAPAHAVEAPARAVEAEVGGPPPLRSLKRQTPPNTKPFLIQRSDVAELLGTCVLIDIFDRTKEAHSAGLRLDGSPLPEGAPQAVDGAIALPGGWTERTTQRLIGASPRALWLMARAGLIPVSETQALEAIIASGKRIERQRFPVAKVQTFKIPLMELKMRAFGFGARRVTTSRIR